MMRRVKRNIEIRPSTMDDVEDLIKNMNRDCVLECEAMGKSPEEAVHQAYRKSDQPYTGLSGGCVGAMFGVAPFALLGNKGRPWMLSTDIAGKEWLCTARASKRYILNALNKYEELENFVDYRYKLSIRWLRWLGFTIEKPTPHKITGKLLCKFYMKRGD